MTAPVRTLPVAGGVYEDVRGDGHALRVSYHPDSDLCVVSIWRAGRCAATFRIARGLVPNLIAGLADCLAQVPDQPWSEPTQLTAVASMPPAGSVLRKLGRRLRRS